MFCQRARIAFDKAKIPSEGQYSAIDRICSVELEGLKQRPVLYDTRYHVKEYEMDWTYSTQVQARNAYKILVGKPEGKRPLGRP
jgi:hypothetical protein